MRFLLINPNTTVRVTERLAAAARAIAGPTAGFEPETGRFGEPYIASRAAAVVGAHAALEIFRRRVGPANPERFDAVLVACFGEPGIEALREESPVPVLGMAEASFAAALRLAPCFGVVTGGPGWAPMLREFALLRGWRQALVSVRTLEIDGGAIARDPDAALPALAAAVRLCGADGAGAVVLGGAGLVGLARRMPDAGVPVLDSLDCLIEAALAGTGVAS